MKKLLRKWLKRQIIQFSPDYRQEIFEWIYESPISTWRDRLFCARLCFDFYRESYAWLISMQDASNPNCGIVGIATPEEIDKWNEETLQPNHLHYSKSKRKIIDWFLPFDKVIVKDDNDTTGWIASTFSHYWNEKDVYVVCSGRAFTHCLSYNEETARLIGTANDCKGEE